MKQVKKNSNFRREKNKLEEERQNFELEKQRQLDAERKNIAEEEGKKASEEQQYVIAQLKKELINATKISPRAQNRAGFTTDTRGSTRIGTGKYASIDIYI